MAGIEFADDTIIATKIEIVAQCRPATGIDAREPAPGAGVDVHDILVLLRPLRDRHIDDKQILLGIFDALPAEGGPARLVLIAELTADLVGKARTARRPRGHTENL